MVPAEGRRQVLYQLLKRHEPFSDLQFSGGDTDTTAAAASFATLQETRVTSGKVQIDNGASYNATISPYSSRQDQVKTPVT
jgi:hypothetical protein